MRLDLLPQLLLLALQDTPAGPAGSEAAGEGVTEGAQQGPSFFWPMLAIMGIFWFVMIGPERKRKKQREALLGALKKGQKVMTSSGMYGTVVQVKDEVVTLQVADNVRLKFALQAVQGLADGEASAEGKDDKGDKPAKDDKAAKAAAPDSAAVGAEK